MLTDVDKEFDTPEVDENGELIETIEIDEVFGDVDNQEPLEQDNYEGIEDDIVQEGEEEDEFDNIQEVTVEAKENYDTAKEQLVTIFTSILEKGEITDEDNVEIDQVKEQYTQAYNGIKENTENVQKKTLEEQLEELKDGMVGATTDEILSILTDNGRKPWLYKDDDNNVFVDGTSIPELTVLVNKLNLIASDGENEGQIQLTPEFIKLISSSDIELSGKQIRINGNTIIDGLVTANDYFRINEDGSMTCKKANIIGSITATGNIVLYDNAKGFRGRDTDEVEITLAHVGTDNCSRFGWGSWSKASQKAYGMGCEYLGGKRAILRSQEQTYLVCNGGTYDASGGSSLVFLMNSAGDYAFRPVVPDKDYLGTGTYYWAGVNAKVFNNTSDRNLKENVTYLSNAENIDSDITIDDCYNFFKSDLPVATYNYINDESKKIGFIAQDVIYNNDETINKIGQLIVNMLPYNENTADTKLTYDINNVLGVVMATIQKLIQKIENLEGKING